MPGHTGFFTKNFSQTVFVVKRMASPEGTTVKELTERLSLTRRSVFRLLKSIEADLHISVMVKRNDFGGITRYHLPESFIKNFSNISLPKMDLTFDEAVTVYLLVTSGLLQKEGNNFRKLQKTIRILYNTNIKD